MKKSLMTIASILLLGSVDIYAKEYDKDDLTPEIESQLKEEDDSAETNLKLTEKELEKVNTYLEESLEESHDFALDGDKDYELYLMINSIEFLKDGRLVVQVEPQFIDLSDDDKDYLVNTAEGMGQLALFLELGDLEALENDIFLSFRNGPQILGNSKLLGDGVKWKD